MTYEPALNTVFRKLRRVRAVRPTENGKAYYVHTKGEWEFQAVIRESEIQRAAVTVLQSGKGKTSAAGTTMEQLMVYDLKVAVMVLREPQVNIISLGDSR